MSKKQQPIPKKAAPKKSVKAPVKAVATASAATKKLAATAVATASLSQDHLDVAHPLHQAFAPAPNGITRKVLHVGCGQKSKQHLPTLFQGNDWQEVRLDIDPAVKPDIVADMMDMSPVANNSMDALFSSHNLEHVYAYQVLQVLSQFHRVIRAGGLVVITCPDLQAVAFHVAQGHIDTPLYKSPIGNISAQDIMYGHGGSLASGFHYMAHKCGFTAESLGRKLQAVGFRNVVVERDKHMNLWARANKFALDDPRMQNDKITLRGAYSQMVVSQPDVVAGKNPDELDLPPKIWTPLGLQG
jgi:predicted SAM-dependent methyltransferase